MRIPKVIALSLGFALANTLAAAAAPKLSEAEQLRIIHAMSEQLRAKIEKLPVLIPAHLLLERIEERLVTLNRDAVIVDGQRFDGVVVTAPESNASFAWAFAAPVNVASWFILREKGDMKGFSNFLRQTRAQVPRTAAMKPEGVENVTFQALNSAAWLPTERYILWFRFTDDTPAEFTIRAGFFPRPSLNNNALPLLLFPAESSSASSSAK
jgi:hypothetical protein